MDSETRNENHCNRDVQSRILSGDIISSLSKDKVLSTYHMRDFRVCRKN